MLPSLLQRLPACALVGHLEPARRLARQKDYRAAWEVVLAALQLRPFHPEGYLLLAEIALAVQDAGRARCCAQYARTLAPGWRAPQKFLKSNLKGTAKPDWLVLPENLRNPSASPQPRLSACLIVKNEGKFLDQCLKSIRPLASQIVLVDTGSTDRTVEIAQAHGAEVYHFEWCDDFSAARNAALEHVTGDWVLVIDADEELLPEGIEALRKDLQAQAVMAYRLPIIDAGKEDEGCSYVPRLFRNAPALFFVGRVHEQVFSSVEVRRQEWGLESRFGKAALRHHGYRTDVTRDRNKIERNLALLQKAIVEMPGEPNLLMNHGLELVRSGNLEQGLESYWKAFEAMSRLPAAQVIPELRETLLTQLSSHLLQKKDSALVVKLLTSPLAKSGGLTASLHFSHGLALMELQDYPKAADQMRQCLAKRDRPTLCPIIKDIRKGGPHYCLALCLKMMGKAELAAKAFAEALKEAPGATAVRLDFARFLAQQGEPLQALQMLHQFISDKPDEEAAWLLGGEIALSQPEFLEFARDWTGEAIKYFPGAQPVLAQRAEALLLSADVEHSLPLWRRAATPSRPRHLAALFLCEMLSDGECPIRAELEPAVSQEFVKWYRALLTHGAADLIGAIHARLDRLRAALPLASRVLDQALGEAAREDVAENCR